MLNRLGLLSLPAKPWLGSVRKLYTGRIYPYPNHYYNTVAFPRMFQYRETYKTLDCTGRAIRDGKLLMVIFWAYIFFNLFDDPGALLGHYSLPDPSKWTDHELGIPPPEVGSYADWLEKKLKESPPAKASEEHLPYLWHVSGIRYYDHMP